MIGIQHISHLVAYFDGVDTALSRTFLRPVPPDEPALTSQLCALMDAETQRREESLRFNIDRLNEAIASCGDDLKFDFRIDTHQHTTKMENLVSQSDLGLVVEYRNFILPEENRIWSYLLQAKRLHPTSPTAGFDEKSIFKSVDHQQHERLLKLSESFGSQFFKYMLYCPPTPHFSSTTITKIRALHTRNLTRPIYDYSGGLALFDYTKSVSGRVDSGIWLTPIEKVPARVLDLHNGAFKDVWSLSWFFLRHLTQPRSFDDQQRHHENGLISKSRNPNGGNDDLIHGVVTGDRHAIEVFCEAAREKDDLDLPVLKVLPRSTITITASVGHSLPGDSRRAFEQA
jgi:hypothetical protein